VFPVVREVEVWNVKLQEIRERAQVPSSESLIVGLDTSLLYQVEASKAPMIPTTVGREFQDISVIPYLRNAVRDTADLHAVRWAALTNPVDA
jgi:hypothetical protein